MDEATMDEADLTPTQGSNPAEAGGTANQACKRKRDPVGEGPRKRDATKVAAAAAAKEAQKVTPLTAEAKVIIQAMPVELQSAARAACRESLDRSGGKAKALRAAKAAAKAAQKVMQTAEATVVIQAMPLAQQSVARAACRRLVKRDGHTRALKSAKCAAWKVHEAEQLEAVISATPVEQQDDVRAVYDKRRGMVSFPQALQAAKAAAQHMCLQQQHPRATVPGAEPEADTSANEPGTQVIVAVAATVPGAEPEADTSANEPGTQVVVAVAAQPGTPRVSGEASKARGKVWLAYTDTEDTAILGHIEAALAGGTTNGTTSMAHALASCHETDGVQPGRTQASVVARYYRSLRKTASHQEFLRLGRTRCGAARNAARRTLLIKEAKPKACSCEDGKSKDKKLQKQQEKQLREAERLKKEAAQRKKARVKSAKTGAAHAATSGPAGPGVWEKICVYCSLVKRFKSDKKSNWCGRCKQKRRFWISAEISVFVDESSDDDSDDDSLHEHAVCETAGCSRAAKYNERTLCLQHFKDQATVDEGRQSVRRRQVQVQEQEQEQEQKQEQEQDRHICVCDKSFPARASLQAHKATCAAWRRYHTGTTHQSSVLPHACVCARSFTTKARLTAHKATCTRWRSSLTNPKVNAKRPIDARSITYATLRCECGQTFGKQSAFAGHRKVCKTSLKKREFMEGVLSLCRVDSSLVAEAAETKAESVLAEVQGVALAYDIHKPDGKWWKSEPIFSNDGGGNSAGQASLAMLVCTCGTAFNRSSALAAHKSQCVQWKQMQGRSGLFHCVCGITFTTYMSLVGHRLHCSTWEREDVSADNLSPCGMVFTGPSAVTAHKLECVTCRRYEENQPHTCVCGKSFASKQSCLAHRSSCKMHMKCSRQRLRDKWPRRACMCGKLWASMHELCHHLARCTMKSSRTPFQGKLGRGRAGARRGQRSTAASKHFSTLLTCNSCKETFDGLKAFMEHEGRPVATRDLYAPKKPAGTSGAKPTNTKAKPAAAKVVVKTEKPQQVSQSFVQLGQYSSSEDTAIFDAIRAWLRRTGGTEDRILKQCWSDIAGTGALKLRSANSIMVRFRKLKKTGRRVNPLGRGKQTKSADPVKVKPVIKPEVRPTLFSPPRWQPLQLFLVCFGFAVAQC